MNDDYLIELFDCLKEEIFFPFYNLDDNFRDNLGVK